MTTYRNDHEATLARVDALERELAHARERKPEVIVTRVPRRGSRRALFAATLIAVVSGVIGGAALVSGTSPDRAQPATAVRVDRSKLEACVREIQPAPALGAHATDPRQVMPRSIAPIALAAAPCRHELHTLIEVAPLSDAERKALWNWAVQEDELAGAISRIEVYYASDPYKLDNFSTATQLWVEYDRAYDGRNRALDDWRVRFTSS
jgi:hypothetical protein